MSRSMKVRWDTVGLGEAYGHGDVPIDSTLYVFITFRQYRVKIFVFKSKLFKSKNSLGFFFLVYTIVSFSSFTYDS